MIAKFSLASLHEQMNRVLPELQYLVCVRMHLAKWEPLKGDA